jgi:hypothetical protein
MSRPIAATKGASGPAARAAETAVARLDEVGAGYLVRTQDDPVTALRMLTRVVAAAHPTETAVVCAAPVSAREDLFDVLAERLGMPSPDEVRLGSSNRRRVFARDGIRLVLLGDGPDRPSRERGYRSLCRRIGCCVTGALGPVTVA